MRGKIDLDYDVSPDPSERHRALYLYWPTIEMTGDYTCKISTIQNDVSQTKKMTVYGKIRNRQFSIVSILDSCFNLADTSKLVFSYIFVAF